MRLVTQDGKTRLDRDRGNMGGESCFGLAGLPVVPCLGLVWPGPVMPALPWPGPATTTGRLRRPAAASPPLLLLLDQAGMLLLEQAGMLLLDQAGMVLLWY